MKKISGLLIISAAFLLNASFKNSPNDWGSWSVVSSTYKGIEARVKLGDYNDYAKKYHWEIQFRNRYVKRVQFNYDCTERSESNSCSPNKRKELGAGETSDVTAFLINDSYKIHVCVGDVNIGD